MELLRAGESSSAQAILERVKPGDYAHFNLLFGSAGDLWVAYGRGRVEVLALGAGLHILVNERLNHPAWPKIARIQAQLQGPLPQEWGALKARLIRSLSDRHIPTRVEGSLPAEVHAICVSLPGYGTRSSSLIALGEGRVLRYESAEGPPDSAAFEARLVMDSGIMEGTEEQLHAKVDHDR